MKIKRLVLVMLLLAILAIGAVSASDDADNLTAANTENHTELTVDDVDVVSDGDDDDGGNDGDPDEWGDPDDNDELEYWISVKEKYNVHDLQSSLIGYYFDNCGKGGNISISIDGELCKVYYVYRYDDKHISADDLGLTDLTYKNYTVDIVYSGDDAFEGFNSTYVVKGYWGFEVDVYAPEYPEIDYGDNLEVRIAIPSNASGNIIYKINGRQYSISPEELDEEGSFTIGHDKLDLGDNELVVDYVGDDYPSDPYVFGFNNVLQFHLSEFKIKFNESANIHINMPDDAKGNLEVYEMADYDDISNMVLLGSVPVENGYARFNLTDLGMGLHYLYPKYTGSDYVVSWEGGSYYDVYVEPIVIADSINVYKPNNNLTIIVPEDYEGILTLTIAGEERSVNVTGGRGSIEFFNLDAVENDDSEDYPILRYDLRFESGNYTYNRDGLSVRVNNINPNVVLEASVSDVIVKGYLISFNLRNVAEDGGDLRGNVTVYVDGQFVLNTEHDYGYLSSSDLDFGNHTIEFYYLGNEIHNPANATCKFEIVDLMMSFDESDVVIFPYDYQESFARIDSCYDGGYYTLRVDGEIVKMGFLDDDEYNYNSIGFNFTHGTHDVELIYTAGDVKKSINKRINAVYHIDCDLNMDYDNEIGEDENLTIEFSVPMGLTGNLIVNVDKEYTIPIVDGKAKLNVSNLEIGEYNITVRYDGDEYPELASQHHFSVVKRYGISVNSERLKYGDELMVTANFPEDTVGELYVLDCDTGVNKTVNLTKGNATVILSNLGFGDHWIRAKIISNATDEHDDSSDEGNYYLFYTYVGPIIDGEVQHVQEHFTYGDERNLTLNVELPDDANGILYLYKNDNATLINQFNVVGGKATVLISNVSYGSNQFYFKYDDEKYHLFENIVDVSVGANITYPKEITVGDDEYFVMIVPSDAEGSLDAFGMHATFENGVAKIPLSNLSSGEHYRDLYYNYQYNGDSYVHGGIYESPVYIRVLNHESSIQISNSTDNLIIQLNEDATGNLIIASGNESYVATLENGRVDLAELGLTSNNDIFITYSGDAKYRSFSQKISGLGGNITSKVKANLKVNAADIDEGETAVITFTINSKATGNILVQVGGANLNATITNGAASLSIPDLAIGKYDVAASYEGNEYVLADNNTVSFNVYSSTTGTFSQLSGLIAGTPENGILNLTKDYVNDGSIPAGGIAISKAITIDGKGHTLDANRTSRIFDVQASDVTLKNIHFINGYCASEGGAIYWNGNNGAVFNCSFANCSSASNGGAVYWNGDNGVIEGAYFENCIAESDGDCIYVNGDINVRISESEFVGFENDTVHGGNVTNCSGTGIISSDNVTNNTLIETRTMIMVNVSNIYLGDSISITGFVFNENNAPVEGSVDLYANSTLIGSQGNGDSFPFTPTQVGKYLIEARFAGDSSFDASAGNITVNVVHNIVPEVVPEVIGSDNDGIVILEFPRDAEGTVEVFVDGVLVAIVKIKDGIARIDLSKYKGNYTFSFVYSGDNKYPAFEKVSNVKVTVATAKIIANKFTALYTAGQKYTVTVYDNKGNLAKNALVVFKIKGKEVGKAYTDSKGVATYKVTDAPGTYQFSATALGVTASNTLTVKHLVTLKKATVKKSAKKLVLTATLAKVNKKYLKNKKVTFKFNGKKYTAKTNKKGVAKVTIKSKVLKKLKVGKKVTYQATYLKDTVKKIVKVKK